jgi:hypothetical protein
MIIPSPHDLDADMARLTSIVIGLVTMVGLAYNTWQNVRAKAKLDQVHAETMKAISKQPEDNAK